MQRNSTIRSLDGTRGVAALLVAVYHFTLHTEFSKNFYLFVDLFFILSGYVMIRTYGEKLSSQVDVRSFMFRRFGRLYPLHIAMLILAVLSYNTLEAVKFFAQPLGLGGLLNSPGVAHVSFPGLYSIVTNVFLLQGFDLSSQVASINGPSWSISVEFYTYFIFALAMLWIAAKWRKAAFLAFAAFGMSVTIYHSIVAGHCMATGECMDIFDSQAIFRCIGGFFIGVLIYEFDTVRWMKNTTLALVCQIGFLVCVVLILTESRLHPALALVANVAFAGLILSLQTDRGPLAYLLNLPPIQYLGKISYSIYLCHWSFLLMSGVIQKHVSLGLKLAMLCAYLLIVLVVATFSFRFIEEPFRLATRRIADRRFVSPAHYGAEEAAPGAQVSAR